MSPTLQLVIVAIVVLVAAAYIGRRVWKKITQPESSAGCGTGCGTCSQTSNSPTNVVPLESLTSSIDHLPPSRN